MQENNYSHIPVYDSTKKYIWVLTESWILGRMASNMWNKDLDKIKIGDLIIKNEKNYILYVNKKTNIYQIDEIFTIKKQKKQKIGAVLITENWKKDSPLLGIITAGDTALVDTYVIH
jgi:predicted transcriptional regulator